MRAQRRKGTVMKTQPARRLAIGVGLALLAGCSAPVASTTATDPAQRLRLLVEEVTGTAPQQYAYAFLRHRDFQQAVADCVATTGETYRWAPFIDRAAGSIRAPLPAPNNEAYEADVDFAKDHGFGHADFIVAHQGITAGPSMTDAAAAAAAACGSQANARWIPDFARDLSDELDAMILNASTAPGVPMGQGDYSACLAAHGQPAVDHPWELAASAAEQLAPFEPSPNALPASGAGWDRAVAAERAAAVADAQCRTEAFQRYLAAIAPMVEEFRASHAAQIATVSEQWAAVAQQVEATG